MVVVGIIGARLYFILSQNDDNDSGNVYGRDNQSLNNQRDSEPQQNQQKADNKIPQPPALPEE